MTGSASDTRFCTSTWAMSESVSSLKVTVSLYAPSLVHCDDMYTMPSTPLTCSSIGAATVSRTVCGAGSRIEGRHLHRRRRHLGILRHRQREHGHASRQDEDHGDDGGEDRTIDEEARNHEATP